MEPFCHPLEVRWSDCDANQHVRHTAYADFCTHARIEWLRGQGFGFEQFQAQGFGPVIFKEWTEYFKELRLSERIHVRLAIAGLSQDSKRFCIRHEIYKGRRPPGGAADQQLMDRPDTAQADHLPPELGAIFAWAERTEDFQALD